MVWVVPGIVLVSTRPDHCELDQLCAGLQVLFGSGIQVFYSPSRIYLPVECEWKVLRPNSDRLLLSGLLYDPGYVTRETSRTG